MQGKYEIHYVRNGHKEVAVIQRDAMDSLAAWKEALLLTGGCAGAVLGLQSLAQVIARAMHEACRRCAGTRPRIPWRGLNDFRSNAGG